MKLKILHTNDVHSHFEAFGRAASLIKEYKDENTIVLDGGDFADFKSIELQGTKGMAAIELLRSVGYDALTIGNNEMFNGFDTLEHMAGSSPIPFISNNLYRKDKAPISGVKSSVIMEKNGLRIFITGASPDLQGFNDGLGVHISDYKNAIKEELVRHRGTYDVCILLNHVGTEADEELANELDEVDIILSAHDHQLYAQAKSVNGTVLNSAGCYGEYVGLVEVEVTNEGVELIRGETISTKPFPADQEVIDILKDNKEKAIEALSRPLYTLDWPLWHDVMEENPMANLIADGLQDMLKCDFGLINSGIVNAGAFQDISHKKLIEICPSPLNPTSFEILGKYIRKAIKDSLDAQVCLADGRGPGFRGKFVGRLHVSGAEIIHEGRRISEILIAGAPLEDEKWYSVASSDYLQRGSGYESLGHGRNEKYLPEEIRDVIRIYAERGGFIEKAQMNRWREGSNVMA
ncbi:5'-nucleotidase C-terminal domain-containing protein [Rossellomorea vietnamensis]|uniref:5'-nucleotidase C-terminal domain-containing protein n=1 Tax=Rossellomorea vietnamensis TaxID=218284 RepID=A0ACD4CBN4_9BACI|nr:5'-nucleotidase C-terminal domain-containing protein [Rossellomorea vietnamensis]UXH46041.1 5'-nucleotidase C-terminal domain-containing protein [Rossellomorea vietnamensis]